MTHYFCTYISKEYTYKGIMLYLSLKKHDKDFRLFVICENKEVKLQLIKWGLNSNDMPLMEHVEKIDKELSEIKSSRKDYEYIWSAKASIILYLFVKYKNLDHLIWLDSDMLFFSSPQAIYDEFNGFSILLTEERFTEQYAYLAEKYGQYQMGFIGFRKDPTGLGCLNWFRKKLLEWCFDRFADELWADQKYADRWLLQFDKVGVCRSKMINLTPFILYRLNIDDNASIYTKDYSLYIQNEKVVLFHFYGFKYFDGIVFDLCHEMTLSDAALRLIYLPYINESIRIIKRMNSTHMKYFIEKFPRENYIKNYFNLNLIANDAQTQYICTSTDCCHIIQTINQYQYICHITPNIQFFICCMDNDVFTFLSDLELSNVILIDVRMIENEEMNKSNRKLDVSFASLSLNTSLMLFILRNNYKINQLTYIDPNYLFISNPATLFDQKQEGLIYITSQISIPVIGAFRDQNTLYSLMKWRKKSLEGITWVPDSFSKIWKEEVNYIQL